MALNVVRKDKFNPLCICHNPLYTSSSVTGYALSLIHICHLGRLTQGRLTRIGGWSFCRSDVSPISEVRESRRSLLKQTDFQPAIG